MHRETFMMPQHTPNARPSTHVSSIWRLHIVGFLLLAVCGNATVNAQESVLDSVKKRGVLRAGIRFDNPPHSFLDARGRWVGFDVDIAEALATEIGVTLKKVKVNELTRISYLQSGRIDVAVASMSHTLKRDHHIDFSQTYFWSKQTFLVRKGDVEALVDLVGKRVAMDRGSHAIGNWRDWLTRHGFSFDPGAIVEFGNKHAAVEAVRQGAVAGYAEDYEILASFAKRHPSLTVLDVESIGMKQDGIGVRENDSKMRDAVNFALQRIETSGKYEQIYHRWFGPDSDTPVPLENHIEVWPHG
jgi:polar amino acid transport system substrate-binding protein